MPPPTAAVTTRPQRPLGHAIQRRLLIVSIVVTVAVVALLFGLGWSLYGPVAAAALGAAGLGALVGVSELVSRYTDSPEDALSAWPGILYITVNILAACAAFGLAHGFDLLNLGDKSARLLTESLVAGIGAMAFFRSSVFTARVGGNDVAVGPASVLQIIMTAVDRACDRERARPRAEFISGLMNGVSFQAAADILPQFCFSAMQNVSVTDQQTVLDWVKQIKPAKDIGDEQKNLLLGLRLLNIVGTDVLASTINGLGPRIRSALKLDLTTLSLLLRINFIHSAGPLIELCYALAQGSVATSREALAGLVDNIGGQPFDNDVKVLLLASGLLKAFGDSIVLQALSMVVPAQGAQEAEEGQVVQPVPAVRPSADAAASAEQPPSPAQTADAAGDTPRAGDNLAP